ncbi:DUF397 domain-containing protein [Nocardia terpenica]|uniref:DUF397 domain-containing protein n=1 Tax=Nocardia terpenica TaxID=455432 RepID=UPI001E439268|nr:DUF397 domain-containing protein [Nocardia terpenica]
MSSERPEMNTIALAWRTSSYSGSNGGECVEVAFDDDRVLIRDSKYLRNPANDPASQPVITMSAADWSAFLGAATAGIHITQHDLPTIERADTGEVSLRAADGTVLTYTAAEWLAFTSGVRDGEFAAA